MIKVKLCGLRRLEDVAAVNEAMPDYVGFVFANSRRQIGPAHAALLKERLHQDIKSVGVFVNEQPTVIAWFLESGIIDIAQLHGRETKDDIRQLKQLTDKAIVKAVPVIDGESIRAWEESPADYLLFDHGKGGTGQSFDWSLLHQMKVPYFLAGGIHAGNVEQAMALNPFAVDISSGIETNGKKDRKKIIEIVRKIRYE